MNQIEKNNKISDLISTSKIIDYMFEEVIRLLDNRKEIFKDYHSDLLLSYKEILIEEIKKQVIKIEREDIDNVE